MFEVGKKYKDGSGNTILVESLLTLSEYPLRCRVVNRESTVPTEDTPSYNYNGYYFEFKNEKYDLVPGEIIDSLYIGDILPAGAIIAENATINAPEIADTVFIDTEQPNMQQMYDETLSAIKKGSKVKLKVKKFTTTCALQSILDTLAKVENKTEQKSILAYLNTYYGVN